MTSGHINPWDNRPQLNTINLRLGFIRLVCPGWSIRRVSLSGKCITADIYALAGLRSICH